MKEDKEVMRLLKVDYLSRPVVNTSKGLLSVVLRKDEDRYILTLDAVPLDEELQTKIFKLYGKDIQGK